MMPGLRFLKFDRCFRSEFGCWPCLVVVSPTTTTMKLGCQKNFEPSKFRMSVSSLCDLVAKLRISYNGQRAAESAKKEVKDQNKTARNDLVDRRPWLLMLTGQIEKLFAARDEHGDVNEK